MTDPTHDPLAAALRRDAPGALPEPPAHLDGALRQALDAAYAQPRAAATHQPSFARTGQHHAGPLMLLLSGAAAALLLTLSLNSLTSEMPDQPAPITPDGLALSLNLQHPSSELLKPLAALVAGLNQPLLAEWQHLTQDAAGTADYLLAQVQRPLQGLRSLAQAPSLSPGQSPVAADG